MWIFRPGPKAKKRSCVLFRINKSGQSGNTSCGSFTANPSTVGNKGTTWFIRNKTSTEHWTQQQTKRSPWIETTSKILHSFWEKAANFYLSPQHSFHRWRTIQKTPLDQEHRHICHPFRFQNLSRQNRMPRIAIWNLAGVQAGHWAEFHRPSPNSSCVCKPSGDDAEQDKTRKPPALTWLIVWWDGDKSPDHAGRLLQGRGPALPLISLRVGSQQLSHQDPL